MNNKTPDKRTYKAPVKNAAAKKLTDPDRKELDMVFAFEHMECDQVIVKWFKTKFN